MNCNLLRARAPLFFAVASLLLWFAAGNFAPALESFRLAASKDDPVALAEARLDQMFTSTRFAAGLDAALAARDEELAESFIELGARRGFAASPEQHARLSALHTRAREKAVEDFSEGFLQGARENGAGFAGALVGDLTGYGDLRDLWNEAKKLDRNEEPDALVVGLAATGLALSAATWSSVGALLPARYGLTMVKGAQRAGRLSAPLAKALTAAAAKAVGREALAAGVSAGAKLDLALARAAAAKVVRPGALAGFRALDKDAATLFRRAGAGGVKDALAIAEDAAEFGKAAKLAQVEGSATRAILATLGRGALIFGGLAVTAANAVMGLAASLLGLGVLAQRFGFWLGRRRLLWN